MQDFNDLRLQGIDLRQDYLVWRFSKILGEGILKLFRVLLDGLVELFELGLPVLDRLGAVGQEGLLCCFYITVNLGGCGRLIMSWISAELVSLGQNNAKGRLTWRTWYYNDRTDCCWRGKQYMRPDVEIRARAKEAETETQISREMKSSRGQSFTFLEFGLSSLLRLQAIIEPSSVTDYNPCTITFSMSVHVRLSQGAENDMKRQVVTRLTGMSLFHIIHII